MLCGKSYLLEKQCGFRPDLTEKIKKWKTPGIVFTRLKPTILSTAREFIQLGNKCKVREGTCNRGRLVGLVLFKLKYEGFYSSPFVI